MAKTRPPWIPPTTALDLPTPVVEFPSLVVLRKALKAIRRLQQRNYDMALQMIQESISNHKESPHLYSLEALICKLFAQKFAKGLDMQLMHLDQAVTSAESAREKLPNSLYFALLLVGILYERAVLTEDGWDLVIRQCKNALSIKNSTDPGVDGFLEKDKMRNSSKESRIEDGKKQIKWYLHACQHRIKVDAAEMELRMKRMKAAVGRWIVKINGASHLTGMKYKVEAEEAKKLKDLWSSSLSAKKKKEFRIVNLKDLEKHAISLEGDDLALDLSEAISSAKDYKTWKYWECFCGNQFGDCNMYRNHFRQSHGSTLALLKEEIGVCNEWIANYLKGVWKPVDTDMATHFILKQLKSEFDIACDLESAVSVDLVENPGIGSYLGCFVSDDLVFKMKERVVFNERFSGLLVDIGLLGSDLDATDIDNVADNASAAPFPLNVGQDDESSDGDNFLLWMFEGLIWEDLETWTSLRDFRRKKAKEVYQIFEEKCSHIKKIWENEEIVNMQLKIKAIQVVDNYIEEIENREKSPEHVAEHCVNFLRMRREDLQGEDNIDGIIESEVISDVLKEAAAAAAKLQLLNSLDLEISEDGLRLQEELRERTNNHIRIALESVREKIAFKNAVVLRSAGSLPQDEMILEKISACDYRLLIVPLLKSLFQKRLEPLLDMDDLDSLSKEFAIDDEKSKGSDGKGNKQNNKENKKKEMIKSTTTYESLPEERSEDYRKSESEPAHAVNVLGVGLKNEALDCFLNVIIQSLWHLIEFRVELMSRSLPGHDHTDHNACIFCALKELFSTLKEAYNDKQGEAVDPTNFRNALISHTGGFTKGKKHDALDCLEVILVSLHNSFISFIRLKEQASARTYFRNALIAHADKFNKGEKHDDWVDNVLVSLQDTFNSVLQTKDQDKCFTANCFVHTIFGLYHHERTCCVDCSIESGHQTSTFLSFNLNATILRIMKDTHGNSSFDELMKLVNIEEEGICDRCGEKKHIHRILRCLPHVFTLVLGWTSSVESSEVISKTLSALSTELNLNVIFQGCHPDSEYFLVSMVCFHGGGEHYICFINNQRLGKYVMFNDTSVEVTGSWNDVVGIIEKRRFQPTILFFHQKSRMKLDEIRDV